MHIISQIFSALVPFQGIGIVLAVIGGIAVLTSITVFQASQSRARKLVDENLYDDPDEAPEVARISRLRKLLGFGGLVVFIIGMLIAVSPQWATLF